MIQDWVCFVPRPVEEVYAYFSDPHRLDGFTPPFLRFELLSAPGRTLVPGMVVDYRLSWHGIPFFWRTLIEEVEPGRRFVDSQAVGPYRSFRHAHEFYPTDGGTLMVDRLEWTLPLAPLSCPFNAALVRPSLEAIFLHRRNHAIRELAPEVSDPARLRA